jgi:DNA (cytosine-5)-methyltransferase 1
MNGFKVISLFSGCGGLDFGFAKAGYEIIFANDFNRFACETYRHNFTNIFGHDCSYLVKGDINKLFDQIPEGADVMIGGAPCQSWSMMGNRKGADDIRGQLIFKQIEVLKEKKPRTFIWENVKGILSHDEGNSFNSLIELIQQAGYEVHFQVCNLSEYGVSQRRERVIIWGKPIDSKIDLLACVPRKASRRALKLGDLLTSIDPTLSNHENQNLTTGGKAKEIFGEILRPGENLANLKDVEIARRFAIKGIQNPPSRIKGFRPLYRLASNEVAPTMVFNNGTNIPWHPWKDRELSVAEAAAIQSFPIEFIFKGKLQEQYKQVANAVPPAFSTLLAQSLLNQLTKENV